MASSKMDGLPKLSASCVPPSVLGTARLATAAMQGWSHLDRVGLIDDADEGPIGGLYDMSVSYQIESRRDEALALQEVALSASPLFRVWRERGGQAGMRVLAVVAPGDLMMNAPLDFLTNHLDVQLDLLFLRPGQALPDEIPEHDVAFFGASQGDAASLRRMQDLFGRWPRPVLNDPGLLPGLARDKLAASLRAAPGICSPATAEVGRDALQGEAGWQFPLLVRPTGSHAGAGLERLEGPLDLARYLRASSAGAFYVSEFVDYRDREGLYRKYRIAFIQGRPHLCHMAVSEHWMVHYLNAGMTESAEKRAAEAAAMAGFGAFAARHEEAFSALNQVLPFDFYSIDCSELPDGRLLVFEADTAAIIHMMDPADHFPYKHAHMPGVFAAFGDMLHRRAAPN